MTKTWTLFSYNSKRFDFDNYLFDLVRQETNTILIESKKIKQLEQVKGGIQLITSDQEKISATIVIGCDGANSFA